MKVQQKNIVLGITGSIAAYKSVMVFRSLQKSGANLRVVMTPSAEKFIGRSTFSGLSGRQAVVDMFDSPGEIHVELSRWADAMVVAPATMSFLARCAVGDCRDIVSATFACTSNSPRFIAPAMHYRMWSDPATCENVSTLRARHVQFLGPEAGELGSGETGIGRMLDPEKIARIVLASLDEQNKKLAGKRVVVTAGPTVEDIDPVRFLTNRSSGKMGYALAEAFASVGAEVKLISGPVSLPAPANVGREFVRSAQEMQNAIQAVSAPDIIVMSAAVADFRPARVSHKKIKKTGQDELSISLERNPDILAALGKARDPHQKPILVGFALETENLEASARGKLINKNADLIVGNLASEALGKDENQATLFYPDGKKELPRMNKTKLADTICDFVVQRFFK